MMMRRQLHLAAWARAEVLAAAAQMESAVDAGAGTT